jgi:hypothetical protein
MRSTCGIGSNGPRIFCSHDARPTNAIHTDTPMANMKLLLMFYLAMDVNTRCRNPISAQAFFTLSLAASITLTKQKIPPLQTLTALKSYKCARAFCLPSLSTPSLSPSLRNFRLEYALYTSFKRTRSRSRCWPGVSSRSPSLRSRKSRPWTFGPPFRKCPLHSFRRRCHRFS